MLKSSILRADNAVDILQKLAKKLKASTEKDNNEYCFDIPKTVGSGYFKAYNFDNGISIIEGDILLNVALRLHLKKEKLNPLVILLNTESPLKHLISSSNSKKEIDRFQSLMFSNNMEDYHTITIPKNKPTSFVQIFIDRKVFESKLFEFLDDLNAELKTLFLDLYGVNLVEYKSDYSLDISSAIDDIKNCDKEGLMRSLYIESRVYEIFTLYLQHYVNDLCQPEKTKILRQDTIDKVKKAAKFIKNDLATSMSVNQIAKKVGLNQNTLQAGFQHLFDMTVNDYIKNKRIEEAKYLIETSDLNITQITYGVGINSRSYFSKLFKEKYKLTPKEYANRHRKGKTG